MRDQKRSEDRNIGEEKERESRVMGRFSDTDLKTIPSNELFLEFVFENWIPVFGAFVGAKAFGLYFYSK